MASGKTSIWATADNGQTILLSEFDGFPFGIPAVHDRFDNNDYGPMECTSIRRSGGAADSVSEVVFTLIPFKS